MCPLNDFVYNYGSWATAIPQIFADVVVQGSVALTCILNDFGVKGVKHCTVGEFRGELILIFKNNGTANMKIYLVSCCSLMIIIVLDVLSVLS